jgi:hypothetical protein
MAKNGNNILVYAGSTLIGCTKTNEIQTGCETIEISSQYNGVWRSFISGRKEWSITVAYLVVDSSALAISGGNGVKDLLQVGNSFTLSIKRRGQSSADLSGSAILKSV